MTRCLDCDALIDRGSRCASCQRAHDAQRSARRGGWDWVRVKDAVVARDGGRCTAPPSAGAHGFGMDALLEVDHIMRLADGGTNDETNLRTLCRLHHRTRKRWEQRTESAPLRPESVDQR